MAEKFPLSYLWLSPESTDRVAQILDLTGDSEKTFFSNVIRAYFKRENPYYIEALKQDAKARGLEPKAQAAMLVAGGIQVLPAYVGDKPVFTPSPIATIPEVEGPQALRRPLNYLKLSKRNRCLLQMALIIEGGAMPQLLSKLLVYHFRAHWVQTYEPQFKFEEFLDLE